MLAQGDASTHALLSAPTLEMLPPFEEAVVEDGAESAYGNDDDGAMDIVNMVSMPEDFNPLTMESSLPDAELHAAISSALLEHTTNTPMQDRTRIVLQALHTRGYLQVIYEGPDGHKEEMTRARAASPSSGPNEVLNIHAPLSSMPTALPAATQKNYHRSRSRSKEATRRSRVEHKEGNYHRSRSSWRSLGPTVNQDSNGEHHDASRVAMVEEVEALVSQLRDPVEDAYRNVDLVHETLSKVHEHLPHPHQQPFQGLPVLIDLAVRHTKKAKQILKNLVGQQLPPSNQDGGGDLSDAKKPDDVASEPAAQASGADGVADLDE